MKVSITSDRTELLAAVKQAADLISVTMGPAPACVTIALPGGGVTINDGVQILRSLCPETVGSNGQRQRVLVDRSPLVELAYDRIIRAAEATLRNAGDGTSSTAILFSAILHGAEKYLSEHPSMRRSTLASQIEADAELIVARIEEIAKPGDSVEVLKAVASIAMHGHGWAGAIAELLFDLGIDGTFTVELAKEGEDFSTEKVDGFTWSAGAMTECLNGKGKFEANHGAFVAVVASEVSDLKDVRGINMAWQRLQEPGLHPSLWVPLVIVCPTLNGNAKSSLINAMVQYGSGWAKAPIVLLNVTRTADMYENLRDLAAACGARLFDKSTGADPSHEYLDSSDLGAVMRVTATERVTTFIPGFNNRLEERIAQIETAKVDLKGEELDAANDRLAKLRGKHGVIKVPIQTDSEFQFLKEQIEDCTRAVQSAMIHGVVPGGGSALYWLSAKNICSPVMSTAIITPRKVLVSNYPGGIDRDTFDINDPWVTRVLGYDIKINALEAGIIDNAASVKSTVLNAAKEAAALVRTEYFLINDQRK